MFEMFGYPKPSPRQEVKWKNAKHMKELVKKRARAIYETEVKRIAERNMANT